MTVLDRLASRPRILALAAGALAALGFQPLGLWPLSLAGMAVLVALLRRTARARQAATLGWLWGVGHFTVGNGWIATAFTYQANMPAWLGWVAVVGLALYLAVFPALATGAARRIAGQGPHGARAWVFTGFAWNPLGVVLLGDFTHPGPAMLARFIGTYGLSGLVAALAAGWAIAAARLVQDRHRPALSLVVAAAVALPALWLHGSWHDRPAPPSHRAFTLVQPDIRQDVLNDPAHFETQFLKTADLSLPRVAGQQRLVLWPESGVPDYVREGYPAAFYRMTTFAADPVLARRRIGAVIGEGSLLLTGASDLEVRDGTVVGARNVVTALDAQGAIRASYAKAHLVPGGEYLPMRALMEPLGLARLVPGDIDFWPGPGPRTLDLGAWGKVGVQVCYEIIFSGEVVDRAHRPDFLFNPSNDGWFGSWGPPQHLAQARLRAIEEGLPVLRATTTGISAVIAPDGTVRQFVGRHRAGRIDGLVPQAAPPTPFAIYGNAIPLLLSVFFLGLSLVASCRNRR